MCLQERAKPLQMLREQERLQLLKSHNFWIKSSKGLGDTHTYTPRLLCSGGGTIRLCDRHKRQAPSFPRLLCSSGAAARKTTRGWALLTEAGSRQKAATPDSAWPSVSLYCPLWVMTHRELLAKSVVRSVLGPFHVPKPSREGLSSEPEDNVIVCSVGVRIKLNPTPNFSKAIVAPPSQLGPELCSLGRGGVGGWVAFSTVEGGTPY